MARPKVLLADDHTLVVEALKSFLSRGARSFLCNAKHDEAITRCVYS